jgi:DNA-directed RNA polymerase specialized sigma24 family protein
MTTTRAAATLARVSMLNGVLTLYDIENVEAFCRAVIDDHLAFGVRTANGLSGPPTPLSPDDRDDLLQYLIATTWRYSLRYHGKDDGRGKLCFSGYVIGILHRRVVDWKRTRWRSTRYLKDPIVETPYDDELSGAVHHDDELIGIDPSTLSHQAQHAYRKVCGPLAASGLEPAEFALLTNQSLAWVMQALRIVRAELEQQGIRPSTMQQEGTDEREERRSASTAAAA